MPYQNKKKEWIKNKRKQIKIGTPKTTDKVKRSKRHEVLQDSKEEIDEDGVKPGKEEEEEEEEEKKKKKKKH